MTSNIYPARSNFYVDEEVMVSKDLLKAIGADTRIAMMKSLLSRQKTQSELASELGMSPPTILEHMSHLGNAGLVELVPQDRERKWKYYRLTKLGRSLVERKKMSVVLLLGYVSAILTGALLFIFLLISSLELGAPSKPPASSGGPYLTNALAYLGTPKSFIGLAFILLLLATLLLFAAHYLRRKKI